MAVGLLTRGSVVATVIALFAIAAATALIRLNKTETVSSDSPPLPVTVVPYERQKHYLRNTRLLGIVRPKSDSALGFEVSGTVQTMPVRAGTRVIQNDVLATLNTDRRMAQLAAARATLDQIDSERKLAGLQRQRLADLTTKGLASQQAFDEARLGEEALQAAQRAALARLHSAEIDIDKSTLRAPYDGVIAARLVEEGAVINAGTPALRLVSDTGYEAHIGVPPQLSTQLQIGQQYALSVGDQRYSVPLQTIRTDVDPATLTVGVVFGLPASATVRTGSSVALTIKEMIVVDGGWLPLSALLEGDRGLWNILVVEQNDGGFFAQREVVEVLYSTGQRVFVRGTLGDNANIIATGLQRLSPGSAVSPQVGEWH